MNKQFNYELVDDIVKISEQINKETQTTDINQDKVTKLMFEQLMKGLYLQI